MVAWPQGGLGMQPKVVHGLSASFLRARCGIGLSCVACTGAVSGNVQPPDNDRGGGDGDGGDGIDPPVGGAGGTAGRPPPRIEEPNGSGGDAGTEDPPPSDG